MEAPTPASSGRTCQRSDFAAGHGWICRVRLSGAVAVRRVLLVMVSVSAAMLAAGCGGGSNRAGRVAIQTRAASGLADAPVRVDVGGLDRGKRVTLRARWTAFDGAVWASRTSLRADDDGAVTLRGVAGMRFLWGMRPAGPNGSPLFLPPAHGPSTVTLSVQAAGKTVAQASLSRRVTPASVRVRRLTVKRDGVSGALFTPPGDSPRPAVLVFGGSEGGNIDADAAGLLAAHGYPTLALAYFKAPGLPSRLQRIPLEYFVRAARILRRQRGVDPARLVTMGASRGGEASLLIASTFPDIVHGAIALVPNANVWPSPDGLDIPAWTMHDRPLRPGPIPVEQIDGPVLTAGAGLDSIWSSARYVQQIEQRLASKHFRFDHQAFTYPNAGHLISGAIPYLPPPTDQSAFGGDGAADAAAKADLWPQILHYLADR